jgi:TonB family protein
MALSSQRPLFSRAAFSLTLLVLFGSLFVASAFSQTQPETASKRRLVERTAPVYPPLARSMALQGVVRIEAIVSPDGSVKTLGAVGGHPVLVQAAESAVRQWRWERAPHESRESVELKFFRE